MQSNLNDYHNVHEALADLCNGLIALDASVPACWQEVTPDDMPPLFRELIVHHNHMTDTLERCYGQPVVLDVLAYEQAEDWYRRKIRLQLSRSRAVVEYGLVRMNLRFTPPPVREAILACQRPLGYILDEHGVLRLIEPRWYVRFPASCPLLTMFDPMASGEMFGRVGTIYCDEHPAIELLEIVTGVDKPGSLGPTAGSAERA